MRIIKKQVEIMEVASYIANKNIFYKFIHTFLYLFILSKSIIFIQFRLANTLKLLLTNLPSLLKSSA